MNHDIYSIIWSQEQNYEQLRKQTLHELSAYDGAFEAMRNEPFFIEDAMMGWSPVMFWDSILRRGEVHIFSDDAGPAAMVIVSNIAPRLHANLEIYVPPTRRRTRQSTEAMEAVIEYCFDPHKLALHKLKALVHPNNTAEIDYLDNAGFKGQVALEYESYFDNQPQTMILWELHNPLLQVNEVPESIASGVETNVWDDGRVSVPNSGDTGPTDDEAVPEPWSLLVGITNSQRSMAGAANRLPANAGGSPGRQRVTPRTQNNW